MTQLYCVHKWSTPITMSAHNPNNRFDEFTAKYCKRCHEPWEEGKPEPQVVIAKLVDQK